MKRKIINILIGTAILLLIINILLEVFKKRDDDKSKRDISAQVIDSLFHNVLDGYAIKGEWIQKKRSIQKLSDSLDFSYRIKIPCDIPIPFMIKDIKAVLYSPVIRILSEEYKNYGNTGIKIYSSDILKLNAQLNYDCNIEREYSKLAFIIWDTYRFGEDEIADLMNMSVPFAVTLTPSSKNETVITSIKDKNKEYVVFINDDIDESRFRLSTDLSKNFLSRSVGAIVRTFNDAVYYIIDNNSRLYNSPIFNYVRDEFKKRKVNLILSSSFSIINSDSEEELISLLRFYYTSGKTIDGKTILVENDDFKYLQDEIANAQKKGNKIVPPSHIKAGQ